MRPYPTLKKRLSLRSFLWGLRIKTSQGWMSLPLTLGAGRSGQRKETQNAGVAAVSTGKTLLKLPSAFSLSPCLFISLSSDANWIWI